ncbi:MAG: twin-arginine translocation signal domain-containing protein [Patescibacteria group bacterium]|nr:twin-arginine translocation signal domain-containing protein [Patescibacteria group bacterium]
MKDREQMITRRDFLKAFTAAASAGAIAVFVTKDTSGITPSKPFDYSRLKFKPVETADSDLETLSPSPSPSPEQTLSPDEQKIQNLQNETARYVRIAKESGKFKDNWIDALEMYGPSYIAAAEKYKESGIDWKMLWITHMMESGGSAVGSEAFDKNAYPYVGGMQRNQEIWPNGFVEDAFSSLEYLNSIPANHEGDAQEIAGAAAIMAPNMELYSKLGKENAVFNTFSIYTGSEELADERRNLWIIASEVFPDKKISSSPTVRKAS